MLYEMKEVQRLLLLPWVHGWKAAANLLADDGSPIATLPGASHALAFFSLLHRLAKDYEKPSFGIREVVVDGVPTAVAEEVVASTPFCRLLHFRRTARDKAIARTLARAPRVLLVAPLSGHHATLLRDTAATLLTQFDVFITDWSDARTIPAHHGPFSLDDYVGHVQDFIRAVGAHGLHVMAVCQPAVPVLAAISLMASRGEGVPASMVLMGGPIDPRQSPTAVNNLATRHPLSWFETNLIHRVPATLPGAGRLVYPGFLQHAGFVSMNPGRHFQSHWDFYRHLVEGDEEDATAHRRFYDEYNAVADLPAEYYLDTIRIVFQEHLLPKGQWHVAGTLVDPSAIRKTALLTIEAGRDDISGLGQTQAAQGLCSNLPASMKKHRVFEQAGHYGLFSGRRWRQEIFPEVASFLHEFTTRNPA